MDGETAPSNQDILLAINAIQKKVDLACKTHSTDPPLFKSEGNKQQFEHATKVSNLIESAISSLEVEVDPISAVQHLQQALSELRQRQKLIKIADRSPLGWSTVKEYVADELADDSGDEKRLRKVIRFRMSNFAHFMVLFYFVFYVIMAPQLSILSSFSSLFLPEPTYIREPFSIFIHFRQRRPPPPRNQNLLRKQQRHGHAHIHVPGPLLSRLFHVVSLLFAASQQGPSLQDSMQKTVFASDAVSRATYAPTAPPSEPADRPFVSFPDRPESSHQEPPTRHWEHAEPDTQNPLPPGVKGRLKRCFSFWERDLKASQFIIDVVKNGYKIPFETTPPPFCAKNNRSSLNHPEFVESAISDLLRKNCIVETDSRPFCCNPLTVAEGKKLRLVLDLRHPNKFVKKIKFKYEDLPHITQALDKNQFYFSFDFESGYHHVDIFPQHQQYLGFSWTHKDTILRYYKFTVLPFGLNSASYIFTKLTRPLVYHWRSQGILSFIYIDDGLIISPTLSTANLNVTIVRDTIVRSGFVFSEKKCVWQPSRSICYLGFILDSESERFFVPKAKIDKLLSLINLLLSLQQSESKVPVKMLASCAGQLISMSIALGPVSNLMTRALYRAIESRSCWSDSIFLSESVVDELNF